MKKLGCLLVALFVVGFVPKTAHSQVSFYADFSASKLTNSAGTNYLYGPTVGGSIDFVPLGPVKVGADIRGSFVGGGGKRLDGVVVGPRVSLHVKPLNLKPYGEFMFGFARYNDGAGNASTDSQIQVNMGVDHQVAKLIDWRVFEYGYSQYYGQNGQYNPKTFSTGVVFRLP